MSAATQLTGKIMWKQTLDMVVGSGKDAAGRMYSCSDRAANKLVGSFDVGDKLLKAAEAGLGFAATVCAERGEACPEVSRAHTQVKGIRNFIAPTKAPVGVWRLLSATKKASDVVGYMRTGASDTALSDEMLPGVALNTAPFRSGSLAKKDEKSYSDRAVGMQEASLALASSGLEIVAQAAFTTSFGGCKTAALAGSVGGVQLSARTQKFVGSMGFIMFVNHIASAILFALGWALNALQKDRYISKLPDDNKKKDLTDKALGDYYRDRVIGTVSFLKTGSEIAGDVGLFVSVSPMYKAATALAVAAFDLLATWLKMNK